MADAANTVEITALSKAYADGNRQVLALRGVSLGIPEGTIYTFLGPSGCGKTTTLRCVAGLERPDAGTISISGNTVFSSAERVHVPPNRRPIGMVFQSYAVWPHMTVFENVAYPLAIRGRSRDEIRRRVADVLGVVGLGGLEHRPAPRLSGGQQQRVALARALVTEPKVLLLDEPLSNLDAKLREQMRREIKMLQRRVGITTIYVTHDQAEAMAISDRIAVMDGGKLVEVGTPGELYTRPRRKFTATFLGVTNLIEGRVAAAGGAETEIGTLDFAASAAVNVGEPVLISIRPEHIAVHKTHRGGHGNVVAGTVKETIFMGDSLHCEVAVGNALLRVHAHPSTTLSVGESVDLYLPPENCNGIRE